MKKIFTLFIWLLLLPVTALAAGNDRPHSLYVGNTNFASTIYPDNAAYWTSSDGGTNWTSQLEKPTGDSYIHYNGQGTLTLHNANIQGQYDSSNRYSGYGIYAVGAPGNAVSLTIKLEGTNTVSGWSGIFVHAVDGAASLSISGTGSLATEGTGGISFSGIVVQGNGGKAELTINNVDVTATNTSDSAQGILLQSADSSPATLTVNGGELTASGQRAGIKYVFGSSGTGGGTPTVTVSNNAIVRANGGISDDSSTDIQIGADSNESNGGIVFDGKNGTVYGDVTLQEDITIGEGESLTIGQDANLTVPFGTTLTNNGTVTTEGGGTLTNNGKIDNSGTLPDNIQGSAPPKITTASLHNGEVDKNYSQDLTATGDTPITWNLASGSSLPARLSLSADGTISGKPTTDGTFTFTVTATNDSGSDSKDFTLKIDKPAFIPVTGLELNKSTLTLQEKGSYALTAIAKPDDATNKDVTWKSSDTSIATVSEDGTVTAISTATITVTAQDGSGVSTSCSVTVTHSMVHTPKKDATCTEDGNIEYWYCKNCDTYFSDENATEELSDVVIPATGHHYVNGYCTKCGHRDPDYRPDPISYYNIYVEDVCDGVEVTLSNNVVREGNSISVYVKKDTANYTFDNFHVYYKEGYYDSWDELKEGTQPGEYPIKNIWTHIYIKAEGTEEKEDPTGIESIEGVKVYTKDGSLYVQTPQREQVLVISMSGAVVKNEEQVGLKQYHGLQPGIYIVRVGDKAYKLRLN
jgi:hypothetical protein